jgi:hypothetical protein
MAHGQQRLVLPLPSVLGFQAGYPRGGLPPGQGNLPGEFAEAHKIPRPWLRKLMSNPILTTGLLFTLTVSAGAQTSHPSSPQTAPEIGYKSAPDVDQKKTPVTERLSPGFEAACPRPPKVRTVVILTGMWGEKLQRVLDTMVRPDRGRLIVFTQIDWSKIDDPNFSQEMVAQLDDAGARGARGLKILKGLGLGVKDKTGKLITVDDPRLDPIWQECGRLGIPVSVHVTDAEAFFDPLDNSNERYEELIEHPDWSFCGSKFPTKLSILEARDRIIARHSRATFVALHLANWPENLDYVSGGYPNRMVEFGARQAELGRQPRRAREFFLKYEDRIMFGTDNGMDEERYRNHFRWLETGDEYFDYWGYPGKGAGKYRACNCPTRCWEKIYHLSAERIFRQCQGAAELQRGAQ